MARRVSRHQSLHAAAMLVGLGWSGLAGGEPPPRVCSRCFASRYASPFVKQPGTPVSGYSVEIWNEVARRMGVDTAWTIFPDLSDEAQLAAVAEGRADLAISALAVTAEREAKVDFSVPYFDSGLQILVSNQAGDPLWTTLRPLVSPAMLQLFGVGVGVVFVLANILWLVERRHNPAFQHGYRYSILERLWGGG